MEFVLLAVRVAELCVESIIKLVRLIKGLIAVAIHGVIAKDAVLF